MGFWNRKKEVNLKEFSKDRMANEKWIEHYFKIPLQRREKETDKEFYIRANQLRNEIMGIVLGQSLSVLGTGEINKSVNIFLEIESKEPYLLIKFADTTKEQEEEARKQGKIILKAITPKQSKNYLFSPLQSISAVKMLPNVEFGLTAIFKIEPHKNMTWLKFKEEEPIVEEFNGLQYFSYSLAKRIELHKKYLEIDKELFGGLEFEDFIDWVMEKRNTDEHMKKYCRAVEKLMPELQWKYR